MSDHPPRDAPRVGDRPIASVVRDILLDVQGLLRAEMRLAKAEVRHELSVASSAAVPLAMGAIGALSAYLFLLWTAVYALALVLPLWAGTLIVGAASAVMGGILLGVGIRRLKQVRAVPRRTVQSLKENVAWIKQSSK